MNLAIDIGNSLTKMALVENNQIIDTFRVETPDEKFFDHLFKCNPTISAAIIVSTKSDDQTIVDLIRHRVSRFIYVDSEVKIPIKNCYQTPQTLGHDRIAGAVAANAVYPDSNILIFDFGTAITIDFVNDQNEFLGGTISPGVAMRFKALNNFTDKLPLCKLPEEASLFGTSTVEAIENGIVNGVLFEIEGYITRMKEKYPDLRIIFTGGDGDYFAKKIKNPIFATRDLVVYGLNRILEYNAK